jgi:hypothetical protein
MGIEEIERLYADSEARLQALKSEVDSLWESVRLGTISDSGYARWKNASSLFTLECERNSILRFTLRSLRRLDR